MDETELNRQLTAAIEPISDQLENSARLLATATTPDAPARRRPRALWLIPLIAGGALVLTAGTTVTAAVMGNWPWVSLPDGNLRSSIPIPAQMADPDDGGGVRQCLAYIELRNADADDLAKLNAAIAAKDWTEADRAMNTGISYVDVLHDFANEVFPGIRWMMEGDAGTDDGLLAVDAVGETCRPAES